MYKFLLILLFVYGFAVTTDDIYYNSYALIIGIDKYQNVRSLDYAVKDAEDILSMLVDKFHFQQDNIVLLKNEEATKTSIIQEFSNITKKAGANDRVLIFFAGHGQTQDLPDGGEMGYLMPVNGDETDLYVSAIDMDELKKISLLSEAKHILYLIDACYGGIASIGARGFLDAESTPDYLQKITQYKSRQIISAGGRGELVIEKPEWGHSAFTKNLLSGLRDSKADTDSDGIITAQELGTYLKKKVTIDSNNQQTPKTRNLSTDEGEFVFIISDFNLTVIESDNTPTVELDYDKLADKIADRMESNQSSPSEKNDEEVEEMATQADSEPESRIVKEVKSLEVLEDEMETLEDEMETLEDEMEALKNGMDVLEDEMDEAEEMEEGKEKELSRIGDKMGKVGAEMAVVGIEMGKVGTEMTRVDVEIEKLEEQKEDSANELIEKLKDLGIDLESEEIAKISGGVGNKIKDKIGINEGRLIANCTFSKSPIRHFYDEPEDEEDILSTDDISSDNWLRYNRSEGFYYQINRVFQSPNIPGSSFYGGIGRAFHRNEYQWILGLEQLVWKNNLQFYIEGFNKSMTQDAWRLWDGENSLSTLLRKEDYLDWYSGEGFRTAGFVHIKNYVSIGAEYSQVNQSRMHNVLEGEKFRDTYNIEEGDDIYLKSILTVGYPVELSVRDRFQMYTSLIRTKSLENSKFNYTNDHFLFNILIPYAEKLNFNIKIMAGASSSILNRADGFFQHAFEIGGEGTLRGYNWKEISSSHFQLTSIESWVGSIGVFYDRAILFDSPGNVFNATYFSDLSDNISQNVKSSIGFILGRKKFHLSFAKQMTDDKNTKMYLTFGIPLQYW